MALEHITDHFATTVEGNILEQYKESANWQACLKAVISRLQDVEDKAWAFGSYIDFSDSSALSSERLDNIASLVNLERDPGESDEDFYLRLVAKVNARIDGTPDGIIAEVSRKSGDTSPSYIDERPATFFVYTPNGSQIRRSSVQRLAPAGVLGLPGAAMQTADGKFIVMAMGEKILAVAQDKDTET